MRNARLFAETTQRNAELAVINEIGEALAKQLDFQGIIDAVGDRVREILNSNDLTIGILDRQSELISFPYYMENGERDRQSPPLKLGEGLTSRILGSGKAIRVGTIQESTALGVVWQGSGRQPSYLGVPISTGDRVIGVMSVADMDENRYTTADEQLLSTIASSMGVALENARLFDETKRLLNETEQRAAELAIINEIGARWPSSSTSRRIIEVVGDRLVAMFQAQSLLCRPVRPGIEPDHVPVRDRGRSPTPPRAHRVRDRPCISSANRAATAALRDARGAGGLGQK